MSDIDATIAQIKAEIQTHEDAIETLKAQLANADAQKDKELELAYGVTIGEQRKLSPELRAELSKRDWWTKLRHGGYDPFTISSLGDNGRVYIDDCGTWGGCTGVPLTLVKTCEKVD